MKSLIKQEPGFAAVLLFAAAIAAFGIFFCLSGVYVPFAG